jgi:hypothetical protein
MVRTSSILALTCLVACGGGKLSDEDLGTFFAAQSAVSGDVSTQVATEAASAQAGKHLEFEGDAESWDISGEIEGLGVIWDGTIGVDGSGSYTATNYDWDLGLTYEEVSVATQDVTLEGDMDQAWSWTTSDDGSTVSDYTMVGELEATGSIEGRADVDFSMTMEFNVTTGEYSYTYEGTINGTDVNDFSGSGSMDL